MDYEKAFDRAKSAYGTGAYDDLTLEFIFPELRESEDERIRKRLIEYFEGFRMGNVEVRWEGLIVQEVLAWLEKQKENPKSADSIPSDCTSDAKCGNSRHKVGDSLEGRKLADEVVAYLIKSGYQPIIKDTLDQKHFQIKIPRHKDDFFQSTEYKHCREILDEYYYEGDFAGDVYTLYVLRQKEQKPVEIHIDNPNIQKFDPDVKVTTSDSSASGDELLYVSNKSYKIGYRDGVNSVKPAEWSEEDEKIYAFICDFFENCWWNKTWNISREQALKMLKSLRLQPKPEWSKEDEMYLSQAIETLEHENYFILADKLKSLRPSWKPSEDEERLINTSISFLKDFADKGYENAVECIDWLKSKLNGNSGK